jgi:hypothetical protein
MPASRIDLAKILGLDPSGMKKKMRRAALAAIGAIGATARKKLNTSLAPYVGGLRVGKVTNRSAEVVLVGTVPNLVEQGMGAGGIGTSGAYDMRAMVLKHGTKSLKVAEEGHLYLHVPFGFTGAQVAAVGGAGTLRSAQSLLPTLSAPGGGTLWGGRLGPAAGRLAGLVRMQKTYSKATQSGFAMWRTMSEKGQAWTHPGVAARNIFGAAKGAINAALAGIL